MAGKELKGREKVVSKMTRDGLTEENLADGSVKDISHKSWGRPPEMKQDFVFDREKKKDKLSDGQSEERNLQKKQIRNSSLRKEAISEEPILEESVLDGEGTGEKNVSGESLKYKKKFREHAQIPEDDSLTGQKKKIRKKQIQKQMRKEQTKSGRLSFDDEENQMVKGPGMKLGRTIGKYAVRDAISKGISDPEEEEQDVATETVQFAERGTETAVRGLRYAQLRSQRADVKANRRGYHLDETGEKLKFGMSDSMGKAGAEETAKKSEEKKRVLNRFFQRKRYKDAYRAARTGKTAGSAGGAATVAGVENITVKAKIALKEIVKRNRAVFFGAGIFVLLFLIVAVSLGSCSASIQGGGSVIEITTYPGTDEDIYAAENYYVSLETALNQQINEMEATHPDYDEYQYNVGEIAHNPYVRPIHVMVMGSMIEQLMGMGPETILKDESVQSIAEVISNGMGSENPMFIVTNSQTVGGAGVIFYPEVMDQIGEGFQGNFFILPSSTHETLVIPDNGAFDYRVLEDMVQTINENEVAPEERLSDHVYHYDVKDRVFERADKFAERQKEKAAKLDKNEHTGKEQKMEHPKPKKHAMEL